MPAASSTINKNFLEFEMKMHIFFSSSGVSEVLFFPKNLVSTQYEEPNKQFRKQRNGILIKISAYFLSDFPFQNFQTHNKL